MSSDRQIPFGTKLAFGIGQTAEGIKNTALAAFTLFYFTQILAVPPDWLGTAVLVALIFDAITDPMAGRLSDITRSRWGRRHPYMYISAIPLGVSFYFLFAPPAWVSESFGTAGLFWWVMIFLVLTRGAMTLYHVPHLALGAEMTQNFIERTSIVAHRQVFNAVGIGLTTAVGFGYFLSDPNGGRLTTDPAAYPPMALFFAVVMVLTIWVSAWFTRHEVPHLPQATEDDQLEGSIAAIIWRAFTGIFAQIGSAFQNASFRWLFGGVLIVYLMVGTDLALNTFIGQYFWELTGAQLGLIGAVTPLGLFLGASMTRGLHRRFGKRAGLVFGTAGWALCQVLPVILRLVGWFPENGDSLLFPLLIGFRLMQGVIVQQSTVSYGSMLADVVDEHELASGKRQEGVFFGASAFSSKASVGLGSLFAGYALALIDWPIGAEVKTAADVAPETLIWLGIVFGPMVCGFAVLSVWCFSRYKLDAVRHREVLEELARVRPERAAARAAAAATRPVPQPVAARPRSVATT